MTAISPLYATAQVALGGAIGAALRFNLGRLVTHVAGPRVADAFPWATLSANVLGSIAMGLLAGWLARHGSAQGEQVRLLLGVGLLGGFTTFSSFSLEMMLLVQRGNPGLAVIYAGVSIAAGLLGLWAGLGVMRIAA